MEINNLGTQLSGQSLAAQQDLSVNNIANNPQGISPDAATELSTNAENAFGALFFSLLQNILSEAQNNSSA